MDIQQAKRAQSTYHFLIMELLFHSFPFLFTFMLFMFFMITRTLKRAKAAPKLPPGPWKLPIIGNMHQLAFGSLPHHTLRDLAWKHGPLMHLQLGEVSTIVVSSPEAAKEVMRTHDTTFSQRPYLLASRIISYDSTNIVFAPYGRYWRQLRKICVTEVMSPNRVQSFNPIREEEVSNFIATISSNGGSPINLSKMIFSVSFAITSRAAFGSKSKYQERFVPLVAEVLGLAGGFCLSDMYPSIKVLELVSGLRPKLMKLHREADKILQDIIDKHRERKRTRKAGGGDSQQDLVDVLLEIQEQDNLEFSLTDNNIKAVILDIFSAGSETSATTIEWAMSELLKNPRLMQEAQAEVRQVYGANGRVDERNVHKLKFLKAIIKETLRLHPPAPLLVPRECGECCVVDGYNIPAKAKVIVNAWAIGRDPRYWDEADRFYPQRFLNSSVDYKGTDFQFIPFGAGRRICPGISFALPNIELPLAKLLYHFNWKLPNGMRLEDLNMDENFGFTVQRKENLILIPHNYSPSSVK